MRPASRAALTVAVLLGAFALGGCTSTDDQGAGRGSGTSDDDTAATLKGPTDVATGLDAPWSVVVTGAGSALISERDSDRILELQQDGGTREVGVVAGVTGSGEGGLLGLAVDPDDDASLFAYSTGADGNRIQRIALTGKPDSYGLGAATTILDGLPANTFHNGGPNTFHNGGRIAFGPDGLLYASVGDAGSGDDAQDRASLAGKILRMTPEGDVPRGNPFPGSLVYSLGHRNVQGLGWAEDGTMFASEFGQDAWDELNVIEAGENYGWPEVEGRGGESRGFTDPVQQWATSEASPSGLAVVDDTVYVANLRGEVLRAIPVSDPTTSIEHLAGDLGRLRTVLAAPDGGLWILTNNTDGRGTARDGDDRLVHVELR